MHDQKARRQAMDLPPLDARHRSNEKRSGCTMILIPAASLLMTVLAARFRRSSA